MFYLYTSGIYKLQKLYLSLRGGEDKERVKITKLTKLAKLAKLAKNPWSSSPKKKIKLAKLAFLG